jgi:hypothetical protein
MKAKVNYNYIHYLAFCTGLQGSNQRDFLQQKSSSFQATLFMRQAPKLPTKHALTSLVHWYIRRASLGLLFSRYLKGFCISVSSM